MFNKRFATIYGDNTSYFKHSPNTSNASQKYLFRIMVLNKKHKNEGKNCLKASFW